MSRFIIRLKSPIFISCILLLIFLSVFILSKDDAKQVNNAIEFIQSFVKPLPFYNARIDNQAIVKIYDWVWSGEKWSELQKSPYAVCLSTQSSMDRLYWISDLSEKWNGPISLAIFISSPEEWVGLNLVIHHFQKCSQPFRNYVSVHVLLPAKIQNWELNWKNVLKSRLTNITKFLLSDSYRHCDTHPKLILGQINKLFRPQKEFLTNYPQNHLRNVAKLGCGSNWVLATDIDIIPVANSAELLANFVATREAQTCKKCAFVIPTFELHEKISYPGSKIEIVHLWKDKVANPFHFMIFKQGHAATNYTKWAETDTGEGPVKILYESVIPKGHHYEPFYLSPNTIPAFSERFIGYGFTRNSQVQEALSEGWRFFVLSPIFNIHWGLQTWKNLKNLNSRKNQTAANRLIYNLFKKELDFKNKLNTKKPMAQNSSPNSIYNFEA